MLALFVVPAQAVHDAGVFQLDRDALTANQSIPPASHDWDQVCQTRGGGCTGAGSDGAANATFDTDVVAKGDNIFTGAQPGGTSKDPELISGWRHTTGSAPDKDDLAHAYSAQYLTGSGLYANHTLLYFGADRFAVTGDSQIGFWFFRSKISEVAPPAGSTIGTFKGAHTARVVDPITGAVISHGDILVLSDFLKGGASPTVRVFEWVGSGGSDGSIDLIQGTTSVPADCLGNPNQNPPVAPVGFNDPACAVVNIAATPAPWSYTPKAGPSGTFPSGAFYEGGIDLTAIGVGNECFNSFMAETRSSQSPTATLKDYVLSGFGSCSATMDTTPSKTSFALGGTLNDSATITVSGTGTPVAPTGAVDFFVCGPPATSCDATGTSVGSTNLSTASVSGNNYTVTSPDFKPPSAGTYCFFARWTGDTNYPDGASHDGSNECFTVISIQPTIATTQSWVPNDSATVTVASGAGALAGTIQFQLFKDSTTCANTAVYDSGPIDITTGTDNGGGLSRTVVTSNTTSYSASATFSWLVTYTNTNPGHKNVTSACNTENSSLTVTGNAS
jgi:hypothetical protein